MPLEVGLLIVLSDGGVGIEEVQEEVVHVLKIAGKFRSDFRPLAVQDVTDRAALGEDSPPVRGIRFKDGLFAEKLAELHHFLLFLFGRFSNSSPIFRDPRGDRFVTRALELADELGAEIGEGDLFFIDRFEKRDGAFFA